MLSELASAGDSHATVSANDVSRTLAVPSNSEKNDSDAGGDDGAGVLPDVPIAPAADADGPAALMLSAPCGAALDMAAGVRAPMEGPHELASYASVEMGGGEGAGMGRSLS